MNTINCVTTEVAYANCFYMSLIIYKYYWTPEMYTG